MKLKLKLFNKRISIQLPKIKLSKKNRDIFERHRHNIPGALLISIMLVGLMSKQPTQAGTGRGAVLGGASGALIGGAVGGGKGAALGGGLGLLTGAAIGSASKNRYSDPAEKRLNKLYKKKDATERRLSRTSSPDKQRRYQQQLDEINNDIRNLEARLYGGNGRRNSRGY